MLLLTSADPVVLFPLTVVYRAYASTHHGQSVHEIALFSFSVSKDTMVAPKYKTWGTYP